MRKFRKYTATALVAMMVAGMTMSGYQPADWCCKLVYADYDHRGIWRQRRSWQ